MPKKNNNSQPKSIKSEILETAISAEMKKSYLDYAMSVIVARALPDVKDGLKPVQRRILYAMHRLGLRHNSAHKKSARIVGETIGKYHPHGDTAVYDAMVRMAQDFSLRYPLVDGQGNFGSVDGDTPAAMRYTEARLSKIAEELLIDLDKNTVPFVPNFDASEVEPAVLPAKLPNFFLNGADGIAVGMATKIPPHNLEEIVDSLVFVIDELKLLPFEEKVERPDWLSFLNESDEQSLPPSVTQELADSVNDFKIDSDVSIEDLMEYLQGPDFPTGGHIYDQKEIVQAYATGRGRILMRGESQIKKGKNGRFHIVISEIPYQVNKAQMVAKIAELVKDKKLKDIADIRDESDRRGMRVVVTLKSTANPKKTLNALHKYTPLQTAFYANLVALVNGEPQLLTLKMALVEYLKHRKEIVIRRSLYDLYQALYRAHILEGLKIALDHLDEVIETIKKSADTDKARENLMKKFKLSYLQAQAILDMQLKRLAALERQKILDELAEKLKLIESLKKLLQTPAQVMKDIKEELLEIKEAYGDERRTKVHKQPPGKIEETDLIKDEEMVILLSRDGYIKRLSPISFRTQGRGGKGVRAGNLKEEDVHEEILSANNLDTLLFFTDRGKVYSSQVFELPKTSRTARGVALVNLIPIEGDEKVTSVLALTKN